MSMFIDESIDEIVKQIKNKSISLNSVCEEVINRSDKYSRYKMWASFNPETLRAAYSSLSVWKANSKYGEEHNQLDLFGIPIGIKDVMNTIEYPTQMGSIIWRNFQAGNDARIVSNIKYAGGVTAGKTVTAEFAVHTLNETLNPYDVSRTPGTSSSGSAVAVALGIVPVALATQTAGSIIRPSSFCGVYGYMPSFGLIPRTGILKTTDSLDTVGFITSNVKNLSTMLHALEVKGPDYPFVYAASKDQSRKKKNERKWKIGFIKTYTWSDADDYVKKSILDFIDKLEQDNEIEISELNMDRIILGAHEIHETIYDKSLAYYFANEHHDKKHVSDIMNLMIEHGEQITPGTFQIALEKQLKMCQDADVFMQNYDAIISISTASIAPLRGVFEKRDPSLIWTLLHLPAVNVPLFREMQSGLPFGIQIVARRFNDELLIQFIEYLARKKLVPNIISEIKK